MQKLWIGCDPNNFTQGRKGLKPDAVVIHAFTSLEAAEALFADPASDQSCHYVAAADGTVHQYVDDRDTAYHAGLVINPSWALLRQGVNPNLHTLGVAAAIAADAAWPDSLYDTVAELVSELCSRWGFSPDGEHVVLHSEIRASKNCTGRGFDRPVLLGRLAGFTPSTSAKAVAAHAVQLVAKANLRDGAPSTRSRIVRTLTAGNAVEVVGFTDHGERVNGNAIWYQTPEHAYLWAGATDAPHPIGEAPAPASAAPPTAPVAETPPPPATVAPADSSPAENCGIPRIDELFSQPGATPIGPAEPAGAAIGAIQDLLSGHGHKGLPSILASIYGHYGSKTAAAIKDFQGSHGLPANGEVDFATLHALVAETASSPRISQVYLARVLGVPYRGLEKILCITAQMEGVGKFGALNLNTDGAGLSYGIIQWAQKPGRLSELLRAFSLANRDLFVHVFGDGDAALADALLLHVGKPHGGVNTSNGAALNPGFNLVEPPWTHRFDKATRERVFQKAQVAAATAAFRKSLDKIRDYAPEIVSERGIAFMLDVANQFGDGGLKRIHGKIHQRGMTEMELIDAIADETVEEIADRFKQGVRARRDGFLHTALLADQPIALADLS